MSNSVNGMEAFEKAIFLTKSSLQTGVTLPHILLATPHPCFAEHFAEFIAKELDANIIKINGEDIATVGDLAGVLTNLCSRNILLLVGTHKIASFLMSHLSSALMDFSLDLSIDSGPSARTVQVKLNEFTLIASVPNLASLTQPIKSRFFCCFMEKEILEISKKYVEEVYKKIGLDISSEALELLYEAANKTQSNVIAMISNAFKFLVLRKTQNSCTLTRDMVSQYLAFCGTLASQEKLESISLTREITAEVRREVWRRDNGKCVQCGSQDRLEYDHIIPFSRGGSNSIRNIQLLCEFCNRKKSAKI